MEKVVVTRFSDPMMGLAWACEPALRSVTDRFPGKVSIEERMVVLVRDVSDFMTTHERSLPEEQGLAVYNARLAQIYLDEEHTGGMPICMDDFSLFAPQNRSSKPLCLAYKAAQIACRERAEDFLYRLRRATVQECRQTTREDVLVQIAEEAGIDPEQFAAPLADGRVERALAEDAAFAIEAGVRRRGERIVLVRQE